MKAVIQRVSEASVSVQDQEISKIGPGLLVLLGIDSDTTEKDFPPFINKLLKLRIFNDESGKMNLSVTDIEGELLIVSQFTLYGDCKKGTRPNFMKAAPSAYAEPLFEKFVEKLKENHPKTQTGKFGESMKVSLCNDGPVTLII